MPADLIMEPRRTFKCSKYLKALTADAVPVNNNNISASLFKIRTKLCYVYLLRNLRSVPIFQRIATFCKDSKIRFSMT